MSLCRVIIIIFLGIKNLTIFHTKGYCSQICYTGTLSSYTPLAHFNNYQAPLYLPFPFNFISALDLLLGNSFHSLLSPISNFMVIGDISYYLFEFYIQTTLMCRLG